MPRNPHAIKYIMIFFEGKSYSKFKYAAFLLLNKLKVVFAV